MNTKYATILTLVLFFSSSLSLSAQYMNGGGNRNASGGLFSVVSPGKPGRMVTVGGRLSPSIKMGHSIPVSGFIKKINVKVGDYVITGQPLLNISRDIVGETFLPAILESRINGLISEINVFEKQEVKAGDLAITIIDNTSFLLNTTLSDRDAQAIRKLGSLPVTGTTTEGISFQGRITGISQEPDYSTGLFTLTMRFPNSKGLFLGMVIFVDLAAQVAEGITVEKTAIVKIDGEDFLWVIDRADKLTLKKVETGKEVDLKIIINKGLKIGEKYLNQISGNEAEGISTKELIKANLGSKNSGRGN